MARLRTHNNRAKRALLNALKRQQAASAVVKASEPAEAAVATAKVSTAKVARPVKRAFGIGKKRIYYCNSYH